MIEVTNQNQKLQIRDQKLGIFFRKFNSYLENPSVFLRLWAQDLVSGVPWSAGLGGWWTGRNPDGSRGNTKGIQREPG